MKSGPELLLADDEAGIRRGLGRYFESEGFAVRSVSDGKAAVAAFREKRADAVLLDVNMFPVGGVEACRELRQIDAMVPIVFMTALPSEIDEARTLSEGADDYVEKDRGRERILLRVRAALRRAEVAREAAQAALAASPASGVYMIEGVSIDLNAMTITNGARVERMTKYERQVIKALIDGGGEYVSTAALFKAMHGPDYFGGEDSVRSCLKRLNTKLGPIAKRIDSYRGRGYRLRFKPRKAD